MMVSAGIIAILRGITPADCVEQVACLRDHGITTIEITTNSPEWSTSLRRLRDAFGDGVTVGAGTVLTPEHVAICAAAGGQFILTPNLDLRVIHAAKRQGLGVCAGVMTPSEIFSACEAGADVLKIFPASALPENYPQMIKGPLSAPVRFSAVGGVDVNNAADYLRYYDSVGIGSALYRPGQPVVTTAERCAQLLEGRERGAANFARGRDQKMA
ncbi:beta/alpha barrel domain-containing protein [Leclercia tamurae]|uniref:2-dehydro-3-deoxyphosphogluconate aldolase n=1 Tax=Leclercia tamurae TaxID=2926467 RepID=A0ABT2RBT6_9ENTR|nr:2-dehydro-3-deoxyphosphogluconate aldolase [Leclercia tamurae]MCT9844834.1 2-dehydro-3-deoxyphosphogluconate aldolase [Leclercia adecarboxylata ATCC 23216 = NBRC 102595]MCU6678340.1 2-dehydro-3-deoxyphosphogluconate aldolase [Leclercia tamurae]